MRRLLFPARTCLLSSVLEDEGHLDLRSVLRDLALFDVGCLIKNPNASQITQCLVRPVQCLADRVLPSFRRRSDDRRDSRDGHNAPPVSVVRPWRSEREGERSGGGPNRQGCRAPAKARTGCPPPSPYPPRVGDLRPKAYFNERCTGDNVFIGKSWVRPGVPRPTLVC